MLSSANALLISDIEHPVNVGGGILGEVKARAPSSGPDGARKEHMERECETRESRARLVLISRCHREVQLNHRHVGNGGQLGLGSGGSR